MEIWTKKKIVFCSASLSITCRAGKLKMGPVEVCQNLEFYNLATFSKAAPSI